MTENPLDETGELSEENLRDVYDEEQPTVNELVDALEREEYSTEQLYALQTAEREGRDRTTAHEALDSAINDAVGPGGDDYEVHVDSANDLEATDSDNSEDETEDEAETEVAGEDIGTGLDTDPEPEAGAESEADQEDNQEMDLLNAEANSSNESPAMQQAIEGAGATESGVEGLNLPDPYGDNAPETVRIVIDSREMSFAGDLYDRGEHDVEYSLRVKQGLESENNEVRLSEDDSLYPETDDEE